MQPGIETLLYPVLITYLNLGTLWGVVVVVSVFLNVWAELRMHLRAATCQVERTVLWFSTNGRFMTAD